ncbi:hypothetical protein [Phenylobacterium aquaticum]|uniref:hypothetical protein n=1 Tax=Phenylobacterium aquaticum TaxID=1763816 RepID=UPI001F5C3F76|nr:hypothetical protein [Phenylobacterium aquaticum]MCI3132716.1 hypothetical protein [Phenylobacterium aquaticum]
MLGVQVLFLCVVAFIVGAEQAAPGVLKSTITAAAQVYESTHEHTLTRLCARIEAHGGTCPGHAPPASPPTPPPT